MTTKNVYRKRGSRVIHGDCLTELRALPDNSADAIVTDPPYGLSTLRPDVVADVIARWASGEREYMPAPRVHLWDDEFTHLGEITQWVMWYGDIPDDADPSRTTCTVTIDPPVSAYSLDSLMELRREKYEGTP